MNKTIKRLIIAGTVVATGTAVLCVGSAVHPTIAKAGGLGNFYKYKTCTAVHYGEPISGLTGMLSNYDIHNYADQRYHHGTKVTRAGWRQATAPLYDDESWSISPSEIWDALGHSGWSNDGTQDFDYAAGIHTVTFIFSNGKISAKCSIKE